MFIALNNEQKRISIDQAVQGDTFFCPFCLQKMFLKVGKERTSHFSHYPHCECKDSWNSQYDKSDWHYRWQQMFPTENQEVILQWGDIRHRADVLIDHTVIEFQHSSLSSVKFNDRNVFYHNNIGFKVVWLYDMQREYEYSNIVEVKAGQYSWRRPLSTFSKYKLSAGQIELFFQMGDKDKCIAHIDNFTVNGFKVKKWLSKDEFLAYVGLVNGICAPPAASDLQHDKEYQAFADKFNIQLNVQQQRAVQSVNGATLMVAVPGSGKTTVLVARVGYMIFCKGIRPESILAITYTNSAVQDIRNRIASKFGESIANRVDIRTINSLCERIISIYSKNRQRFELVKETEQYNIIKSIYIEMTGDKFPQEADIKSLQTSIGYIKNMMLIRPEQRADYFSNDSNQEEFYVKYRSILIKERKMDYDDQLVFAKDILFKCPELLKSLQRKYRYICVDEAQDTSKIQHHIIHQIAEGHNNIFMVGDEDQSIYGFRAAYPQALMTFNDNYVNPYTIFLETNYRSTRQIVNAAQKFICENMNRHSEKVMRPERDSGKEIEKIEVTEQHEQYSKIAEICSKEHGQIAVLYRNNSSAIPIMDIFIRKGIKYKRLQEKGENFFTSRIVMDITSFLKFAIDPYDEQAFMQIYYKCGYGFKKQTAEWSCRKARQKHIDITDELINQTEQWNRLKQKAIDFKNKIQRISKSSSKTAIQLVCDFWYSRYAEEHYTDTGKIDILVALAVNEKTISGFLDRLNALPGLIEKNQCNSENSVILSTVHSAKGLEFDIVYIVDVYNGCFPNIDKRTARSSGQVDSYEEERRLFYVAMTRAKNELYIFAVKNYSCPFADELVPPASSYRAISEPQVIVRESVNNNVVASFFNAIQPKEDIITQLFKQKHQDDLCEVMIDNIMVKVGDKIVHQTRGEGIIKRIYYHGSCIMICVQHGNDIIDTNNYDLEISIRMKFIEILSE